MDENSPLAYTSEYYNYQEVSYGFSGAILRTDPEYITSMSEGRVISILVDGIGSAPVRCVFNGYVA